MKRIQVEKSKILRKNVDEKEQKSVEKREIVERILSIEKILAEREKSDWLKKYNTGNKRHEKQILFHRSKKRNRWVFGGNRSGKTECGAVEAVWYARGIHPYRENRINVEGWVVSLSYEVQRDVAQAKILKYLNPLWIDSIKMQSGKQSSPEYGVIDYIIVKNVFGGKSKIAFKSCDQGREKFQGASLDFVWFDEEPPKDIYDECRMRVLDRRGDIWGTMTPLKGLTWVYDEIYINKKNNPEVWYTQMEWADNPYLDREETDMLTSSMSKEEIESRRYGRFNVAEGLVYTEFDPEECVIEPFSVPSVWHDNVSIDPGLNNPLACLFFAVDHDGNVYVIGEHYEAGKNVDYHASAIASLADELNFKRDPLGRLHALIDSAANQTTLSGTKSVVELFYERGIVCNSAVNKDVWSGINTVKSYLRNRRLFIFSSCKHLIGEMKSYSWGKGDKPKKIDDHALDALRYYIMSRPESAKREKYVKSEIEKDKERLIKRRRNYRI